MLRICFRMLFYVLEQVLQVWMNKTVMRVVMRLEAFVILHHLESLPRFHMQKGFMSWNFAKCLVGCKSDAASSFTRAWDRQYGEKARQGRVLWSQICISSIFTEHEDVGICISHAVDSIGLKEMPSYEVIMGEQCDWIKKTQESFLPVEVAEGLWIVPEWRTPPDVQATNIILNPGLAFGTGEHPSTKLCLLLLHGLIKGGELFLDYGTGSGILGIAALKFGAALSVGVDVDPKAITSARQNAGLNNIGPEKMRLCLVQDKASPPTRDGRTSVDAEEQSSHGMKVIAETDKYDIVIANILLNPLIELADHIAAYAKPGAVVGVSGILSEQLPKIIERYSQFLEGISVSEMDGWACVSGTKKEIY